MKYGKAEFDAIIRELKIGKDYAVKSDVLAQAIGITSRTNEVVREIIREMVEIHGYCIGSNTSGFFLIGSKEDLNETVDNLRSRAMAMLVRRRILINNYQHENNLEFVNFMNQSLTGVN